MAANFNIEYITDDTGKKTAVQVQVPIEDWDSVRQILEYHSLKRKLTNAFLEVELIKRGKLPKVTLQEFLKELETEAE